MFRNFEQYRLVSEQFANMWQIVFPEYPELDFHLVSTSLPMDRFSYEAELSGRKHYTGFEAIDSVSFTFRETESFSSYAFFREWMHTIYDFSRNQFKVLNREEDRYKTATIQFLSKTGGNIIDNVTRVFTLQGLSPIGFSDIELDNSNGEPLEFTFDMTVERIISAEEGNTADFDQLF